MSASERERHELAAKPEELLGPDQAATLMEHLPPMRWDALARQEDLLALRSDADQLRIDVARTNDRIEHLTEVMELRFESLGDRITAHVAERVDTQTKLLVFSLLGAVLTATAIALGTNVL